MTQTEQSTPFIRHAGTRAGLVLAALLCLGCLLSSRADAAYEQVGCFAGSCNPILPAPKSESEFPEETQLGGVSGMAVNYTGNGGVPAGTVYAAIKGNAPTRVAMYEPMAGGGLKFVARWDVKSVAEPYERCGPLLPAQCAPSVGAIAKGVDVDVDQTTGNVYAQLLNGSGPVGSPQIVEYAPDGSEEITRFGQLAEFGKKTAETPDEIHGIQAPGGIAVNAAGEVYVADRNGEDSSYSRLMKFKPKVAGKYDEYEYAGVAEDIAAGPVSGPNAGPLPIQPVLDAAGHVYVGVDGTHNKIEEYDTSHPADPAICSYEFSEGEINGMTVNPANGEVFFSGSQAPRRVNRLGPCDEGTGKFSGIAPKPEAIAVKPPRSELWALTFDPLRQVEASRPAGVLYAGAPKEVPNGGGGELGQSSLGYIVAHSKEAPPKVEAESFDHVGATSALLHGAIDTQSFAAHYAFQYLTLAEYEANEASDRFAGAKEAPAGGADLPGAVGAQTVGATLLGLTPGTAYRFRVVATSHCAEDEAEKVCKGAGEAIGFHTFPAESPGLPDKRVYELVSPFDKHGGQVFPASPELGSCNNGVCNKPGQGGGRFPMQSTPDGEAVVYEGDAFGESEGAANENEYLARRDGKAGWQSTTLAPPLLQSRGGQGYKAFSTDLSQGVLEQSEGNPALSPEAPAEYVNLYSQPSSNPLALSSFLTEAPTQRPAGGSELFKLRYAGASADLSRVFFEANDALTAEDPNIAPVAPEVEAKEFNLYEWQRETGELHLVNVLPDNATASPNAAFVDGSAHAISADGSRAFFSDQAGQLYVREDGDVTEAIPDPGKFLAAATDGSKVLLTNGHLYDLGAEAITDLTESKGGFQGLVGQSEDLSHVYFVDTAVLSEEENDQGDEAQGGEFNLYAWSGGETRFVATLVGDGNDWSSSPSRRSAEASPHGRYLAFLSYARLTGYDNTGPASALCAIKASDPGPCQEAFLYDSATGKLTCASCNPSGTAPLGWSRLPLLANHGSSLPQPRYLTDQGRLYFDSGDSLTLFDTNEGVQDVYQWEPNGVGTCKREAGCINLISAGSEPVDSNFVAADEDGSDVFFTTRDQLVLKDKDELLDLYDARVEGGIAAETEVARSECQGEACVPQVSPPNDPTPGSSTFEGAGNVDEKKAAKKHAKKKKKHVKKHKSKKAHKRAAKHNRGGAR